MQQENPVRRCPIRVIPAACFLLLVGLALGGTPSLPAQEVKEMATLKGHKMEITALAFSVDGKTLASAASDEIKLWNVTSRQERIALKGIPIREVVGIAFRSDGKMLAAGGEGNDVKVWDTITGAEQVTFTARGDNQAVAFTADGQQLIVGGGVGPAGAGHVRFWSFTSPEKPVAKAPFRFDGNVMTLLLSKDGKAVYVATVGGTVKKLDVIDRKEQFSFQVQEHDLNSRLYGRSTVTLSADGNRLALGSLKGKLQIIDLPTGKTLATVDAHTGAVTAMAVTPDGKLLVTAGNDQKAILWDASTGRQCASFNTHTYSVLSLAFSPDASLLATGGVDGTVKLWQVKRAVKEDKTK